MADDKTSKDDTSRAALNAMYAAATGMTVKEADAVLGRDTWLPPAESAADARYYQWSRTAGRSLIF
jgi:hypothetical protein